MTDLEFAASVGKTGKYSAAGTGFWMQQIATALNAMPGATFSELLAAYPGLLDARLGVATRPAP